MLATGPRAQRVLQSRAMQKDDSDFFPSGAVAFFAAMLVFYAGFWLLLMAVMVRRG